MTVKAVSLVAKSGTGKTTLLAKVIVHLKERGYKVGVIKHDAHRSGPTACSASNPRGKRQRK